ncbi:MAG: TerB family tellurite resistance protein [Bdellovibrionales bacterium]|nr:TerB family tellurite resistance protein [Massilia sp.]
MRHYANNSPHAAGRLLALTMVVDGNLAESELSALHRSRILKYVELDQPTFQELLHELCEDLLTCSVRAGQLQLDPGIIDGLLREIDNPDLRRRLLQAMWSIADADGWLADGEAVLLARASVVWAAETHFVNRPVRQA